MFSVKALPDRVRFLQEVRRQFCFECHADVDRTLAVQYLTTDLCVGIVAHNTTHKLPLVLDQGCECTVFHAHLPFYVTEPCAEFIV